VLVAVSKGMQAEKPCINKILQFFLQVDLYNGCKIVAVILIFFQIKITVLIKFPGMFTVQTSNNIASYQTDKPVWQ